MAARTNGLKKTVSVIQTINYNGKTYSVVVDTVKNKMGLSYTNKKSKQKFSSFNKITSFIEGIDNLIKGSS